MLGIEIELDVNKNLLYIGPVRPVIREHKGKSRRFFPDTYVMVDLETTGLDPRYDEIIEIAAVKYSEGSETERFQALVKPENKIDEFISSLTGITNNMLRPAQKIDEVLPAFLSFVSNHIIVGHNVNFDVNFIYDYTIDLNLDPFSNDYVDTMRIAKRLYPELANFQLSELASHLQIRDNVAHRALPDCLLTQQCFVKMRESAAALGGIPKASWERFNSMSKMITPEVTEFDSSSPLFGRSFAFTGKLERMTRKEALQVVANAGGICCDGVTVATNYLVLGNNDYCKSIKGGKSAKQKKAEKMKLAGSDITIISEDVFYDMLNPDN